MGLESAESPQDGLASPLRSRLNPAELSCCPIPGGVPVEWAPVTGTPPDPTPAKGEAAARRKPVAAPRKGVEGRRAGVFGEAMRLVGRVEGFVGVLRAGAGVLGSDTKPGVDLGWAAGGGM